MFLQKPLRKLNHSLKLSKMKYVSDQKGIINRYLREKEGWDVHHKHSKEFILESAKSKKKGKVVILGSGWLLDVPLKELSEQFQVVLLIDIIHPAQALKKMEQYDNVSAIESDITGGLIDYTFKTIKNDKKDKTKTLLTASELFNFSLPSATDFVVSLNVMTQLNTLLTDYMQSSKLYSENELQQFARQVQEAHLNILPKEKTCLITEYEEELVNDQDELLGVNPLIFVDLPQSKLAKTTWKWKFDSSMTYRDKVKTWFNVTAIDF
ncbi:MAG: hypothetical protein V2I54_01725 [Bacteroidales bacterium]|jgi:hypothetical protein|nr:hypothetical protein [Bacteroidales bacterium]